jgi:hypothetical protein
MEIESAGQETATKGDSVRCGPSQEPAQAVAEGKKKSLATTYSPTLKGQYHRRGRA